MLFVPGPESEGRHPTTIEYPPIEYYNRALPIYNPIASNLDKANVEFELLRSEVRGKIKVEEPTKTSKDPLKTIDFIDENLDDRTMIWAILGDTSLSEIFPALRGRHNPTLIIPAGYANNGSRSLFTVRDRKSPEAKLGGNILSLRTLVIQHLRGGQEVDVAYAHDVTSLGMIAVGNRATNSTEDRQGRGQLSRLERAKRSKRLGETAIRNEFEPFEIVVLDNGRGETSDKSITVRDIWVSRGRHWGGYFYNPSDVRKDEFHISIVRPTLRKPGHFSLTDARMATGLLWRREFGPDQQFKLRLVSDNVAEQTSGHDKLLKSEEEVVYRLDDPDQSVRLVTTRKVA